MPAAVATPTHSPSEALLAARNAFKLGGSLLATWGVALGVRILLPRFLGPALFGPLTFADAFATLLFVPLGLGVETYIRKEVSVRPRHASDFFGGIFALRVGVAMALFAVAAGVMYFTDRPPEVRLVVYIFGGGQVLNALNTTLAALLHARGRVGGLSLVSVASKLVWAAGIGLSLATGPGLAGIALAFLVSEAVKAAALGVLTRGALDLEFRVDLRATWAVLVASLPFYVNALAMTAYSRIDVNVLSFTVDDPAEVGLYAAASSLAGLTLLVTPLISWVLTPYFSRERERSEAAFDEALRRSIQVILAVAIPTSLMMSLGADLWIRIMFGQAFANSAAPLRLLAPVFALTYVATLTAIALVLLDRGWSVTRISLFGMALNLALNLGLAPLGRSLLGPGGGGIGCAAALILTEALTTGRMLHLIGWRAFDRASLSATFKTLAACAAAVAVDRLASGLGQPRLVLDFAVYLTVVLATGALPLREFVQFTSTAFHERRETP